MIPVLPTVINDYVALLRSREIPPAHFEDYKKWLRYFYDFYANYLETDDKPEKVRLFLEKLRSKKQTPAQCQQAAHAISLYFELQFQDNQRKNPGKESLPEQHSEPSSAAPLPDFKPRLSQYSVAGYQEKSDSREWDEVIDKLAAEIKVRHYSRKTLKTYAHWSRQFQRFLKNKPPQELSSADIKEYLTYLAVKCKVAASTQNQAFCIGV